MFIDSAPNQLQTQVAIKKYGDILKTRIKFCIRTFEARNRHANQLRHKNLYWPGLHSDS